VINTPYYKKIQITSNDKYIIMASDGLWDVVDDKVKKSIEMRIIFTLLGCL